jgi:hypothetical protein
VVHSGADLPKWAPRLTHKVITGHDEFDQVMGVFTDDEVLCLTVLDVSVREALLAIPGASLVCDGKQLVLASAVLESAVDAELVDAVRAVVAGVCVPAEMSTTGN